MNLEYIDQLIEKMDKASLTELSYKDKVIDISLKREPKITTQVAQPVSKTEVTPVEKETISDTEVPEGKTIKAPMVGTFYQSPSPEADPYIQVGDKIENDTIVCILEAMKLFNEIEAEVSGEIVDILVEDGEMVEYNQPLFRVK
ncbi:acetyl-CoA carboxylase biotin carboxyl carrier protein [Nosocomiicoccus ampullae]|uniref:Biotin carboxyl carrier protein of acetyl-CoA carboxylase n=1 Tax=Nosocomiicoccus ampullae TaxID=489910 RepID=A0A9Q2HGI3_9STAP|nr:acetyl-CoA carboxylase biotin carboxyl carrier protein [Nosocomiicoccus ampullae]MBB5176412.1 acetyl-CoA carboxylase biotin carboxyl carrier protein [Nosocomiicoccus ampullae]QYA46173.1 acetyl-CoA carboxylase biotin carboxyl carrier protein [Nosocomiicoccus ampullae]